jgi:hypothetical protein
LTLSNIPDDMSGVSSASWTIPPSALGSKGLTELLAPRSAGFVYVTSDVPLIAQALEGRVDNSMLAGLPPMHSQPGYQTPSVTVFSITGAVLHNGKPLAGANVQLTGPVNASTVTDASGNYKFGSTPAGQYSVRVVDAGYVISPTSTNVTVTAGSQRASDFNATLLVPFITVIQPSSLIAGSPSTDLIIAGGPFVANNQVIFDGTAFPGTLTQAGVPVTVLTATGGISVVIQTQTVVKVTIPAAKLVTPRLVSVAVQNVGPGGSTTSSNQGFTISPRSSSLSSSVLSDPLAQSILGQPAVEPSTEILVNTPD